MMSQSSLITLQLLDATHQDALAALANDPQVSATSSVPYPCPPDVVEEWAVDNRAVSPPKLTYVVLYAGQVAGACSLKHINYEERHAELSYWIGRPYWGLGLAGRAAMLLRDLALEPRQFGHLVARCLQFNNPYSQRIIFKLGFLPDESTANRAVMGRWADAFPGDFWLHYILTRERWLQLKANELETVPAMPDFLQGDDALHCDPAPDTPG